MTNKGIKLGKNLEFNLKEMKIISNGNFLIFYRTGQRCPNETTNNLEIYNPFNHESKIERKQKINEDQKIFYMIFVLNLLNSHEGNILVCGVLDELNI